MGLFSKKADPITLKEKALSQQLAALQSEIKQLSSQLQKPAPEESSANDHAHGQQLIVRSTATPHSPRPAANPQAAISARNLPPREPIFESVNQGPPQSAATDSKDHFNDLGLRKYDIRAGWRRFQRMLRGPSANNPKLVSYLAAGSIRGLRPLRYEKRIARNRTIALTAFFLIILWIVIGLAHR
jgi:hypothetical protein